MRHLDFIKLLSRAMIDPEDESVFWEVIERVCQALGYANGNLYVVTGNELRDAGSNHPDTIPIASAQIKAAWKDCETVSDFTERVTKRLSKNEKLTTLYVNHDVVGVILFWESLSRPSQDSDIMMEYLTMYTAALSKAWSAGEDVKPALSYDMLTGNYLLVLEMQPDYSVTSRECLAYIRSCIGARCSCVLLSDTTIGISISSSDIEIREDAFALLETVRRYGVKARVCYCESIPNLSQKISIDCMRLALLNASSKDVVDLHSKQIRDILDVLNGCTEKVYELVSTGGEEA